MTDLHTHILPGIDDGSKNTEMSIQMLKAELEQGIDSVALTSHFYRDLETPEKFLMKRQKAFEELNKAISDSNESFPKLYLGAEVAWVQGLADWEEAEALCYEGTRFMLVEPPFQPWTSVFVREMIELQSRRNITPVIAHIDRYYNSQTKESLKAILDMDFPVQISSSAFLDFWSKGTALKYIREGKAQFLISDCHNMTSRRPNLREAMDVIIKKFGNDAFRLFDETDDFLMG